MPSLPDMLNSGTPGMSEQQQERLVRIGLRDLYRLKYKHDPRRESFEKMQFELKLISGLIESMKPSHVSVIVDTTETRKIGETEFNPTLTGPNIIVKDDIGREYSFWYKPRVYLPCANEVKPLTLDFVMLKGTPRCMYNLDDSIRVELEAYDLLPTDLMRELALKLMQKMKPLHLVIQCKDKFRSEDLKEAKDIPFFLKPRQFVVVADDYIDPNMKLNLPFGVNFIENVDMNLEKFTDMVKKII